MPPQTEHDKQGMPELQSQSQKGPQVEQGCLLGLFAPQGSAGMETYRRELVQGKGGGGAHTPQTRR